MTVNLPIKLDIPANAKNIYVALSGGADSALLLYVLAKELKHINHHAILTAFTIPRPDGGANYSPKIVEYINNKLELKIASPLIFGNGELDHTVVVATAIKQIFDSYKPDIIYMAENKIPPIDINCMIPIRSPSKYAWKRIILPFFELNKSHIIDMYYQYDIADMLTLSHSCTTNTTGRCNWCFNCTERSWAFDMLGKQDPGSA